MQQSIWENKAKLKLTISVNMVPKLSITICNKSTSQNFYQKF